jgi:hypothetical protein
MCTKTTILQRRDTKWPLCGEGGGAWVDIEWKRLAGMKGKFSVVYST